MSGWIKLHRSLINWEWYDDANAMRLLIHLLLSVNYEPKRWRGIIIPAGSMVLSWDTLSKRSGLTVRQCRTAIKKLENSGEVTRKVTNKSQLVTLMKWEQMQGDDVVSDKQSGRLVTGQRQASDRQVTTTKEGKESKEDKKSKYSAEFEKFYGYYHRHSGLPKTDKDPASKAWKKVTTAEKAKIAETIEAFLKINYGEFCPKCRTYITAKRWEDDLTDASPKGEKPYEEMTLSEKAKKYID